MVIRLAFAVICVVIHSHCANAGGLFYFENSPVPTRHDNPKGASQYAPSGVLPSGFAPLVPPPATKNVPPSSSMWMKYAQDGQAVAYGYELTDSEENVRYDSPEPQYIRVPNPGYVLITRPSAQPRVPAIGVGKNVLRASQNPSGRAIGKVEELGKDASGIREVVVQAPGKNQNELSEAEYQPAGSADSDYQDYYEYEYDDSDFPDSNAAPVEVGSKSAKADAGPSPSPAQQSTREIVRNSVVISESTSTSVGTTPRPTVRVEVAESRTTTIKSITKTTESPRQPKVIDSRPAYDVIRVGAAYATDVTPKMNAPLPAKGTDYDEYYAYDDDSSEFVDADEPLTSEITQSTTATPIVTTEAPTTSTTTTTTRKPTTTTKSPATTRTNPTSKATAEQPAEEEYDYYEDDEAIPPALKHLHGDEYAFKPTADDEPILSKITEKAPISTTTTTSTTTTPTTTTTTTTTTPTTTTTTTTTTTPTTTTTTTPIPTTTQAARMKISTQQRVSVSSTSSVGRGRRPRIKSTTPTTTTTTTEEDDFAYDDDALLIDRAPEVKTTLEEAKVPPQEENLQILSAPSSTTQASSSSAPPEIMRPTTYRPKLDLARYLAPTASQVATSPPANVLSKVEEIAKDGGFTAEEDDSSSWLGELLQFPHAIPDASQTINSSTEGASSTTADAMAESASSVAELVVEEITTPVSSSTTMGASTVAPSRRVTARGGRRKNARIRVAIRRHHEQDS